ncbi:MAG TPA: right-handed parallel beta-helix repeat-containing protein, partial [Cytophagaceae bacterium]
MNANFQWLTSLIFSLLTLAHFRCLPAKTLFVSPIGNDLSSGSNSSPFLTVQKGLDNTFLGDTLVIKEGGYFISDALEVKNSGTPQAWVTIMAEPGKKVTINANQYLSSVPEGREGFQLATNNGSFNIKGASYLRVEGITIFDSHSAGIYIKNSHNLEITNCKILYAMSSGIGVWYSDSVKVSYCEIMQANTKEKTPKGIQFRVETPHEAISIAGCKYFDVSYNYLHNCEKEGIDVKEYSSYGSVHHNYLHDINRQALYVDS